MNAAKTMDAHRKNGPPSVIKTSADEYLENHNKLGNLDVINAFAWKSEKLRCVIGAQQLRNNSRVG